MLNETDDQKYEISPSDLNQSIVRVVFVSGVVAWSFFHSNAETVNEALEFDYFILSISYWFFSVAFFGWTYLGIQEIVPRLYIKTTTRSIGIIADLGAVSAYTAISGHHGVILYPIYLTCIIGYGYRFGIKYLYLSILVGTVFFSFALGVNEDISKTKSLILAYYLGLLLVPIYSASLLKKHKEVLERIKEVNEARSRFIANMSHELRTPLHAIISVTDILVEEADSVLESKRDRKAKLGMISDSAQHLLNLVNRVLDVASAEAGRELAAKFEMLNLYEVLLASLRICEPKAVEKNIAFYWYIDTSVPEYVSSSAEHLQEILINTIGNAVKYTKSGYVCVRVTAKRIGSTSHVSVNIVDTGIGISAKLLPTIFEPFTLGDDSAAREFSGSGLGLTITKQYIEYLEGEIFYESTEYVGTRCNIAFNFKDQEGALIKKGLPTNIPAVLVTPNEITEDERIAFERSGWNCRSTNDLHFVDMEDEFTQIIFVDEDFDDHHKVVIDELNRNYPNSLIIRYCSPESHPYPQHLVYNSSIRKCDVFDLRMINNLATTAFLNGRKDVVNSGPTNEPILDILVADDSPANLKTALMALESIGHSVVTVTNGEDTLSELETNRYDVALIDMHMPGMSGIEAAKFYQFTNPEVPTPIVILTADATSNAKIAAEEAGAAGYLTKPLRAFELRNAVNRFSRKNGSSGTHDRRLIHISAQRYESLPETLIDPREIRELKELGVKKEPLRAMILDFEIDSKKLIQLSYESSKNDDISAVKGYMHTIKGSSATVGAALLQLRAQQMEELSWTKISQNTDDLHQNLFKILDRSVAKLLQEVVVVKELLSKVVFRRLNQAAT